MFNHFLVLMKCFNLVWSSGSDSPPCWWKHRITALLRTCCFWFCWCRVLLVVVPPDCCSSASLLFFLYKKKQISTVMIELWPRNTKFCLFLRFWLFFSGLKTVEPAARLMRRFLTGPQRKDTVVEGYGYKTCLNTTIQHGGTLLWYFSTITNRKN